MPGFFRKIATRYETGYAAIFIVAFLVAAYIQAPPTFIDPDSFYHAKMTSLLMERGIVRDFEWLPFTTLGESYADHHFLYHALLAPFFALFGPLVGLKIGTVFFSAAAITAFYALLRGHQVRGAFWYAALLATSGGFIFRLNLAKASAMSIAVLLLALLCVRKKKPALLFFLAWAYVWLYGGWPLMAFVVGVAVAAQSLARSAMTPGSRGLLAAVRRANLEKGELRLIAGVVIGLLAGLIVNPYFPTNLQFYWEQIIQIAVINYQDTIGVGGEWYPYDIEDLAVAIGPIVLLFLFGLAAFPIRLLAASRRDRRTEAVDAAGLLASLALAAVFLVLTLRSKRHVEYFAPFAMFFVAVFLNAVLPALRPAAVWRGLKRIGGEFGLVPVAAAFMVPVLFGFMAARDIAGTREFYANGIPFSRYERAAKWLEAHTPRGAIVVHSDWDDFPPLFFWNDRNRYMSGLDPTFFYRHDTLRYWQWVHLTIGKRRAGVESLIRGSFGARYVLIEKDHDGMRDAVAADGAFVRVYSDDEVDIYELEDNDRPASPQ